MRASVFLNKVASNLLSLRPDYGKKLLEVSEKQALAEVHQIPSIESIYQESKDIIDFTSNLKQLKEVYAKISKEIDSFEKTHRGLIDHLSKGEITEGEVAQIIKDVRDMDATVNKHMKDMENRLKTK